MAAIAVCEARETMMLIGIVSLLAPSARSLTPSLMPWMAREAVSSLRVMGLLGSSRRCSIQSAMREILMGDISTRWLLGQYC